MNNRDIPDWVAEMNCDFAVVSMGSSVRILRFVADPLNPQNQKLAFFRETDFHRLLGNRMCRVNGNECLLSHAWLRSPDRRQYIGGVAFAPGTKLPNDVLNLWNGFALEAEEGDATPFLDFIHHVICNGDEQLFEWVISWMADAVQNPGTRPGTAIVLYGGQGVGKSFFAETFGALFGPHFIEATDPRHITGNFNSHLIDKALVFADEGSYAGKAATSKLKNLVTSDRFIVEPKGVDAFEVRNCLRVIIAGNDSRLIKAGSDERRYLVLEVGDRHKEDHDYFGALAAWRENGLSALLHILQQHNLSGINLRKVPRTTALMDMKLESMDAISEWWLGKLTSGKMISGHSWEEPILVSDLHTDYTAETGFRRDRALETKFGQRLWKLVPGRKRERKMRNGRRQYFYTLPTLEICREEFERQMGQPYDWPEEET